MNYWSSDREASYYEDGEIISTIVLGEKPDCSFRLLLNLKKLNEDIDRKHFKMDIITLILQLLTPKIFYKNWLTYDTIPIATEHQKYLKFSHRNNLDQFTNGYCHVSRKFTKYLKPSLSALRLDDVTIAAYLDDCINLNCSSQECLENTEQTIQIFQNLGFTVYPEPKSSHHPS